MLFYLKKGNLKNNFLMLLSSRRAEEPFNFVVGPAPAPGIFFSSGTGSKEPKTPGSGSPALIGPDSDGRANFQGRAW